MVSQGMILDSFLSLLLSSPAMAVHAVLLVCSLVMVFRRGNRPALRIIGAVLLLWCAAYFALLIWLAVGFGSHTPR